MLEQEKQNKAALYWPKQISVSMCVSQSRKDSIQWLGRKSRKENERHYHSNLYLTTLAGEKAKPIKTVSNGRLKNNEV